MEKVKEEDKRYCWTAGSKRYHRLQFVEFESGWVNRGYSRSRCGAINSQEFAPFFIFPIARNHHARLQPCQRCFPDQGT